MTNVAVEGSQGPILVPVTAITMRTLAWCFICCIQVTIINSAPVQDVTDNHLSSEVEEALHIFVEEILPNVNSATQAATLNQEIIPNLSKLIHEFTIDNEASTGLGLADLENGMGKVVEEVLSKSLQCTGGQDMTNSSLVQSITDDLTSK